MPRDEHGLLAVDAELGEDLLHLREDRVVAAAGAPADFLVGGEVVGLQDGKRCGRCDAHDDCLVLVVSSQF